LQHNDIRQNDDVLDAITIGETLAAFVRDDAADRYLVAAVGAESNVAVGMAQLGCRTRWISRLGDDQLGHFIDDCVAGYGVDTQVEWDPEWPTAIMVKEIGPERTRVRYYRSQSAARCLDESHAFDLGTARWIHLTGITPALSPTAAELVSVIVARRTPHPGRVSFDVNYRPALWPDSESASRVLVPLARQADVVFIGDDEANALLGTADPHDIAVQLLVRDDQEVVIKRGAGPASVVDMAGHVSEPALQADVVDLVGAGDAFAAGYLAGACWQWEARARLRLGHRFAARVLGVRGDLGPNLSSDEIAAFSSIRTPESTLD
jgi:2-dehydro-3-deoxygluconokinase